MVEINDNNNNDRIDERRSDEKRQDAKRRAKERHDKDPMRTFEAKLSEKMTVEEGRKNSQLRAAQDQKKTKEDKQRFLEKIVGVAKDKFGTKADAEIAAIKAREEHRLEESFVEDAHDEHQFDEKLEEKRVREDDRREDGEGVDAKHVTNERSEEGHLRVTERYSGGEGGGGGGHSGSGGESSQEEFCGDQQGGEDYEGQGVGQGKGNKRQVSGREFSLKLTAAQRAKRGFDPNAQNFTEQDVNEIITQAELSLNDLGEQEFVVQLTDDYYDGLILKTTRTEDGVVLTFDCPNLSVKSTFLKCRPQLYKHFLEKEIEVSRIDVE